MPRELYPNKRNGVTRSNDKNVRISTHIPVLKSIFDSTPIKYVVEHGMGISSTAFFHGKSPNTILSFENDPKWQQCRTCAGGMHTVLAFSDSYAEHLKRFTADPIESVILIDSHAPERDKLIAAAMTLNIAWIVEHDAETFTDETLLDRRCLTFLHDYDGFQYVKEEPETVIYVRAVPSFIKDHPDEYVPL